VRALAGAGALLAQAKLSLTGVRGKAAVAANAKTKGWPWPAGMSTGVLAVPARLLSGLVVW